MTASYKLHYAPDNASLIIRLVLDELGQTFETVLVDRARDAQNSAAYLKLNPQGLIPTLETPSGPIFETAAICLWLAEQHGALDVPVGSPARGDFLKWVFFCSNTLHAHLRRLFYPQKFIGEDMAQQEALSIYARGLLKQNLATLDTLAGAGHSWFNGPELSLLDLYIPVCMRWTALYPRGKTEWFDLGATPHLAALAKRVEQRPSMQRAMAAEGLGTTPLSAPSVPNPPEGSAT